MRAGVTNTFINRCRRPDSPCRSLVEARVTAAESVKQTQADWQAGDGVPPTGFEFVADGGLRLNPAISALISSTTGASFFTDLDSVFPFSAGHISWGGTEDTNTEIQRAKANLHPNRDGSGKTVEYWRCALFHVVGITIGIQNTPLLKLLPLASPITVQAVGQAAADVTFDFSTLSQRPRPKALGPAAMTPGVLFFIAANFPEYLHPCTVLLITGHKADGSKATNVGWGYDSGIATFGTGNVLRSKLLKDFPYTGIFSVLPVPAGAYGDSGSAGGVPKLTIENGAFTSATVAFTGANKLNLITVPVGDVQLSALYDAPPGTSVVPQIRNDADSGWVTFIDGQFMSADLGLTPTTTRKVQAAVNTNGAGTLTPTLRRLGMADVVVKDLSHVAEVASARWGIDPVTLQGEISECTIMAIEDGEEDFRSAINDLLTSYDIGQIVLRTSWGDAVAKLHQDDWLIDDYEPQGSSISLLCVSALSLINADLPKYDLSGAGLATPDGVAANPGLWTDQGGGSTNLHLVVDEPVPDDTDYVRSPTSPTGNAIEFSLTNIGDPARDTGHFVDLRLKKDSSGGEVLDVTVELRQAAVVKMTALIANIPSEWTDYSIGLTNEQAQSISDYTDIRIRVAATVASGSGARRAQVSWLEGRISGTRQPVVYANQTPKVIYDDLLGTQAEVPARWRGPGVTDVVESFSKTIDNSNARAELDAVAANLGMGLTTSQGRIKAVAMHDDGALVGIMQNAELQEVQVVPGFRERAVEHFVGWNWSNEQKKFLDEVHGFSTPGLTKLGKSRIDAVNRWPEEASRYIYSKTLAERISKRVVDSRGTGLVRWRVVSLYAYPEWEPGDRVGMETKWFVVRDPNSARELRGQLWGITRLTEVLYDHGVWSYTGVVQRYSDIFGQSETSTRLGFGVGTDAPVVTQVGLSVSDVGLVSAVIHTTRAQMVKVATSTVAFPSDVTTRAQPAQALTSAGNLSLPSLATITELQYLYVAVFAYDTGALGAESALTTGSAFYGKSIVPPYASSAFTHSGLSAFDATKVWNYDFSDSAWHTDSAVPGAYLMLDAGSAKSFMECRIYASSTGYAGLYDIEYSDVGAAGPWTAASNGTGFAPKALGLNSRTFSTAAAHRYWRIKLTNTPGSGPWLAELEFIEKSGGNVLRPWIMPPAYVDSGNERAVRTIDDDLTRIRQPIQEFGGKTVTRLLAKTLAGDADSFDGVPGGTHILYTGLKQTALIGSETAQSVQKRTGIFFGESFAETPDTQAWEVGPSGTQSLVSTVGVSTVGPSVLQVAGYMWRVFPRNLPFNPTKLYRLRTRVRQTVDSSIPGTNNKVYIGLRTFLADGSDGNNNGGYAYVCVAGTGLTVAGGWQEFTGWVKGASLAFASGSPGASTDPRAPAALNVNVVSVRPLVAVNYDGSGTPGTTQVDYFQIEEFDEDAAQRTYEVIQSDKVTLYSPVKESGGKVVNRLLAKVLAGDADSLDGTPDGSTYKRITGVSSGLVQTASVASAAITTALIADANVTKAKVEGRNRCSIKNSANQTINTSSITALNFDSENFDVGSLHDTATNNTRITIPSGGDVGIWVFVGTISWNGNATGQRQSEIFKNGTTTLEFTQATSNANGPVVQVVAIDTPAVGDYYELRAFQNSGGGLAARAGETKFCAFHFW